MKRELIKRISNMALRGLSMASRFVLVFAVAKLLSPSDVGLFGLMLATVSLSVLIVGADFYTYAQRELLARPAEQWSFVIQHQLIAQGLLYLVLLPAQAIIFIGGWMDWQNAFWFFLLLFFEHMAQETNRLLVAMHKQLVASWVLFIRMGLWVWLAIPLMIYYTSLREVQTLYVTWLIGVVFAIIWGAVSIYKPVPVWQKYPVNKSWIQKGFKVASLFLLATISFKGLLTFDRYAVEHFSSLEVLGVYVLYIGVVMGLYNFLDPAVFSFLYPKMVQYYQSNQMKEYYRVFKELIWSTLLISLLLGAFIWLVMPYIIFWLDKPIYGEYLTSLNVLILAGFLYALSMIPHYALYAMKEDKWIAASHITALVLFFISIILIQFQQSIETVGFALCIAFGWMLTLKTAALTLFSKKHMPVCKGVE